MAFVLNQAGTRAIRKRNESSNRKDLIMSDVLRFDQIAKRLGVGMDTVRRTVKKLEKDLDLTVIRESRSSRAQCLSEDDANKLIRYFEERDRHVDISEKVDTVGSFSSYGFFYLIQLVPELFPNRVKIGFTDNLETRLREHQTSAPTAKYVKNWECKRSWDQAVMDSITRKDCKLVLNEVYEGSIDLFGQRGDEYFRLMPDSATTVELSEHSPLRANK
jgi:T5orf172 domain